MAKYEIINLAIWSHWPRSSLEEEEEQPDMPNLGVQQQTGDECLYLPNCQTNLVIDLHGQSLLFWHFIKTTAYHLGKYLQVFISFY